MSQMDYNTVVNYLPNISENIPVQDDKFLFFFDPVIVDERFLFGLPFKTGVYIFSAVALIQSLDALFDIFRPESFWLFFVSIIAFAIYFTIAFYAFMGAVHNNYNYAKVSYYLIAFFFCIEALRYVCKSIYKTIEFITPWDGDFLRLDFLIYIFGYGLYLFIYLYLIYSLYRYMIQVKNGGDPGSFAQQNENENKDEQLISSNENNITPQNNL